MVAVMERLTIGSIVLYFLVFLACYIVIGLMKEKSKKELDKDVDNQELQRKHKILSKVFKYFPMAYVVFLIIALGT